jgi:hypothetical protein
MSLLIIVNMQFENDQPTDRPIQMDSKKLPQRRGSFLHPMTMMNVKGIQP